MKRLSLIEILALLLIAALGAAVAVPLYRDLHQFSPRRAERERVKALVAAVRAKEAREPVWVGNRADLTFVNPLGVNEAHWALPRARKNDL